MKYIYTINCSFEDSEFGGLLNVVASDDNECCKILEQHYHFQEESDSIPEEVKKAKKLPLAYSNINSEIVADIVT
jgi:hypothetical protein